MKILVPVDHSKYSERVRDYLISSRLAADHAVEVVFLHVITDEKTDSYDTCNAIIQKEYCEPLTKKGYRVTSQVLFGGAAQTILRVIEEQHIDVLILGTRGTSHRDSPWLGATACHVLTRCMKPVLLIDKNSELPKKHKNLSIVVGIDSEQFCETAQENILNHMELFGKNPTFHLVVAYNPNLISTALLKDLEGVNNQEEEVIRPMLEKVEGYKRVLTEKEVSVKSKVLKGRVEKNLSTYASAKKASLIMMGTHNATVSSNFVLGATATYVAADSRIPVLLIPRR